MAALTTLKSANRRATQELRQKMRVHDQSHADALTHMVVAEGVAGGKILITASRDGNVKAWK